MPTDQKRPVIKVIAVGGAGARIIEPLLALPSPGVECIVCDIDPKALAQSNAQKTFLLPTSTEHREGFRNNPNIGLAAVEQAADDIKQLLQGADWVILVAGLGGSTATFALPALVKQLRAPSLALVSRPFLFESRRLSEWTDEAQRRLCRLHAVNALSSIDMNLLSNLLGNLLGKTLGIKGCVNVINHLMSGFISAVVSDPRPLKWLTYPRFPLGPRWEKQAELVRFGVALAEAHDQVEAATVQAMSFPALEEVAQRSDNLWLVVVVGEFIGELLLGKVRQTAQSMLPDEVAMLSASHLETDVQGGLVIGVFAFASDATNPIVVS